VFSKYIGSIARSGTNESTISAEEDACSSAFSSSGSKRTYSSLDVSNPQTVSSRGTGLWIGHSRRIWDPGSALCVKQVEGDTVGTGGGAKLDRNGGQPEGDVEILDRARHRVIEPKSRVDVIHL